MTAITDVIRVERGIASEEEVAVLVTVLMSRQEQATDITAQQTVRARWSRPERTGRLPGPRSWRI